MEIEERKRKVLQAVIDSYVATGAPVGSNLLCARYDLGVSPATIRNIMAELEELGFLTHPHTSAGRVPTDRGYRFYIDSLISVESGDAELEEHLRAAPALHAETIDGLMAEASQFLAMLSRYAGIVVAPSEAETRYRHIEFVRLRGRQVLIIFVTETGLIQNKFVDLDERLTQHELNAFASFLNDELASKPIVQIRTELVRKMQEEKALFARLMEETYRASEDARSRDVERIYIGGTSQMLESPDFANVEKMRLLFKALDDKYRLIKVLDEAAAANGVKVFIGSENPYFEMQGCSMIVGAYQAGGRVVGALGVIGPTRMQYRQVIHVVDYTSRLLSRLLTERFLQAGER